MKDQDQDLVETTGADLLRRRGRKWTLDRLPLDVYQSFLQRLSLGCSDKVAAASLGICPQTLSAWMSKGEIAKSGAYRTFYMDVIGARGTAITLAEMSVRKDRPLDWLRCMHKEVWAPDSPRLNVSGQISHSGSVDVDVEGSISIEDQMDGKTRLVAAALEELSNIGLIALDSQASKEYINEEEDGNGQPS